MNPTLRELFDRERTEGNDRILAHAGTQTKRLMNLDSAVYREGALDAKTKELLGFVASLVLRCDDCIAYHLYRCHELGVTGEEMEEAMVIGYTIGGSITVPHMRRAWARWDELSE